MKNEEISKKIMGGQAVEIRTEEEGSDDKSTEIVGCLRFLQCGIGCSLRWLPGGKKFEITIHIPSIENADKRLNAVRFLESSPLTFNFHPSHEKRPA